MTTTVQVLPDWPLGLGNSDDNGDDALWETEAAIEQAINHLAARRKHHIPGPGVVILRTGSTTRTYRWRFFAQGYSETFRFLGIFSGAHPAQKQSFYVTSSEGDSATVIRRGTADPEDDRLPVAVDTLLASGDLGDAQVIDVLLTVTPSNTTAPTESLGVALWGMRLIIFPADTIEV